MAQVLLISAGAGVLEWLVTCVLLVACGILEENGVGM